MVKNLMESIAEPEIKLLALEGLNRIESNVQRQQDEDCETLKQVRSFLRKWRCESPLKGAYSNFHWVRRFLRSLTIFKSYDVPLFIDNYGEKQLLSSYEQKEDVAINEDTPIFHVTHSEEKEKIVKKCTIQPSDNKNIIKGTWFGLDNPTVSGSVYGSYSFETTLSNLGVDGLHQGEVVSYKNEVNVILYAAELGTGECSWNGLKKPTDEAVKKINGGAAYVKTSIFVPESFLPDPHKFRKVVSGPTKVYHGPFCVKQKRSDYECKELPATEWLNELTFFIHGSNFSIQDWFSN